MRRIVQYESIKAKTILSPVKAPSMPFEWSLNPYRGCQHGCSFCYARATHSFLGMPADATFHNHILLKSNAPEVLEEQLGKIARSKNGLSQLGRVAIGTATDPYQPAEAKALLTRRCLEILARYQVQTTITTRSPLVLRDVDILKLMPSVTVNLSINTLNHEVWKSLEPSTPSPEKRLETVKQLVAEGIPAGIFLAPILPYLTDAPSELQRLIEVAANYNPEFIMSSFLRLSTPEVKNWFFQTIQEAYPDLSDKYTHLFKHSAYVPRYYTEPVKKHIHSLLEQYGLNGYEPFSAKTNTRLPIPTSGPTDPVTPSPTQLSFNF